MIDVEVSEMTADQLRTELETLRTTNADLTRKLELSIGREELYRRYNREYEADAKQLNDLMNQRADEEGWCDKYELALAEWNDDLTHICLTGRVKEYEVELRVRAYYTHTITVEAKDAEDAKEVVANMDDPLGNLDMDDHYETDFDIDDVSLA